MEDSGYTVAHVGHINKHVTKSHVGFSTIFNKGVIFSDLLFATPVLNRDLLYYIRKELDKTDFWKGVGDFWKGVGGGGGVQNSNDSSNLLQAPPPSSQTQT